MSKKKSRIDIETWMTELYNTAGDWNQKFKILEQAKELEIAKIKQMEPGEIPPFYKDEDGGKQDG